MTDEQQTQQEPMKYYLSLSGGKDSLAAALHLRELGIDYTCIFLDTGWEHPETYKYLMEYLPTVLGQIQWWRADPPELSEEAEEWAQKIEALLDHPKGWQSGFVRWCLHKKMSPSWRRRFCTEKLKIDALKNAFKADDNPHKVNVVGVRAQESKARAKLPERELSTSLDCMVWRPLIKWTTQDVIDIHNRHGISPNPLYLRKSTRVGCYPCVLASKKDIREVSKDETRIEILRMMEAALSEMRMDKADHGAMLRWRVPNRPDAPIDEVLAWSRTERGGRQMPMFDLEEMGCVQWGLCER